MTTGTSEAAWVHSAITVTSGHVHEVQPGSCNCMQQKAWAHSVCTTLTSKTAHCHRLLDANPNFLHTLLADLLSTYTTACSSPPNYHTGRTEPESTTFWQHQQCTQHYLQGPGCCVGSAPAIFPHTAHSGAPGVHALLLVGEQGASKQAVLVATELISSTAGLVDKAIDNNGPHAQQRQQQPNNRAKQHPILHKTCWNLSTTSIHACMHTTQQQTSKSMLLW